MKTLKFDPALAQKILDGEKTSTWRINDDKNLSVDDIIECVSKEGNDPDAWPVFATILVDSVTVKRLGDIAESDFDGHETYSSKEDMFSEFSRFYGTVSDATLVKIVRFHIVAAEESVDTENTVAVNTTEKNIELTEVKLFTDGGSRGNPGPSAGAYVILDMNDNVVEKSGNYLGITTNNQAEYQALRRGLERLKELGIKRAHVYMDSLLVVNQLKGVFQVKNRDLWPIYQSAKDFSQQEFSFITFSHVPRELNKAADQEVNRILDEKENEV